MLVETPVPDRTEETQMLERFKRSSSTDDARARNTGAVATADRPADEPAEDRGIRRDSMMRDDDRTTVRDDAATAGDGTTARERSARRVARTGNGAATASALATAR